MCIYIYIYIATNKPSSRLLSRESSADSDCPSCVLCRQERSPRSTPELNHRIYYDIT